jgi:hypothetical protein
METVGLGFSRKPQLCAGMTVRETNPVHNTFGTGRIKLLREEEEPTYSMVAGVYSRAGI